MNFRAVRTIRRGRKRGESGQAFAELAVSLIAILAVFVGFLLIAALGSDRVSTLIRAREDADRKSSSGVSSRGGDSIRYWDYGEDEVPFTTDDSAVLGSSGDGSYFRNQLTDNSGNVPLSNPPSSSYLRSDFAGLQDSNIFINAADLAEGSAYTNSTLHDHNLDSLESAIDWLFHIRGTNVEETVYMPAHKTLEDRGD